jgi:GT2 family glycosyltransferase
MQMDKVSSARVAIVTLNWNGLRDTKRCLESLRRTTHPTYDVVVVDNGSTGNDVAILRNTFGDYIHLIENGENYGFSEGSNIGYRYAVRTLDPEYIALLNNDTVVDPDWLSELLKPFSADGSETLGATCSLVRDLAHPDQIRYGGGGTMNVFGQARASTTMEPDTAVRTLAGAACLVRRSALEKLGELFCRQFFIYYNDIDLSWRLDTLGYRLRYVPTSVVLHKEGASARTAAIRERNSVLNTRNKYLTFYRNLSLPNFAVMFPLLLGYDIVVGIGGTIYKADPHLLLYKTRGILEFFRTMKAVRHYGGGRLGYLDRKLYLDKLG